MHTILVTQEALRGEQVEIVGQAFHHSFRAVRLAPGEPVRVVDGQGGARWGWVERVDRRAGWIRLGEWAPSLEDPWTIELAFAVPRAERASWLVEKATELGVARFVLLETARSVSGRASNQIRERLTRVAQAALLQCGRARLPEVEGPVSLSHWLERGEDGRTQILILDQGGPPFFDFTPAEGSRFRVAVGPEGGWSDSEREEFAQRGLALWSLGLRPLRIETAAIAAVVQLLSRISTARFDSSKGGA